MTELKGSPHPTSFYFLLLLTIHICPGTKGSRSADLLLKVYAGDAWWRYLNVTYNHTSLTFVLNVIMIEMCKLQRVAVMFWGHTQSSCGWYYLHLTVCAFKSFCTQTGVCVARLLTRSFIQTRGTEAGTCCNKNKTFLVMLTISWLPVATPIPKNGMLCKMFYSKQQKENISDV